MGLQGRSPDGPGRLLGDSERTGGSPAAGRRGRGVGGGGGGRGGRGQTPLLVSLQWPAGSRQQQQSRSADQPASPRLSAPHTARGGIAPDRTPVIKVRLVAV